MKIGWLKIRMHNKTTRYLLALLLPLLLVTGCVRFGVEELQDATMQGDEFQTALAQEYLKFAESEADQYDWVDADYFARKGLRAARGEEVALEEVANWEVPYSMTGNFADARDKALAVISSPARTEQPVLAAKVMVLFDCWLEQQEEEWQQGDIERCRDEFFTTLDQVNMTSPVLIPDKNLPASLNIEDLNLEASDFEIVEESGKAAKSAPDEIVPAYVKKSRAKESGRASISTHVIFFESDSAQINGDGQDVINNVIAQLQGLPEYEVRVHGHADATGSEEYNTMLSKLRAEGVKKTLVEKGVVADAVKVKYHGEAGTEGQAPKGRIVEIFIH